MAELGWKDKAVHLVYDWKKSQKWYVKKMRGMANSRTYEKAILCWKGKFPSGLPRDRQYVDAGSALYVDTMVKVPVLHPKDLTYVDASVLAESLKTMCGLSDADEEEATPEEPEEAASAASMRPLQEHVKKRHLYRTATDESVVWFPHDNHPDLLKEFVWDSGSPRWVLHGTPASGAGIIGCFETGASVVALCEDTHHQKHLEIALRERAVEKGENGSRIFKDETLQARALEKGEKAEKMDVEEEGDKKNDVEGDSDSDSDKKENKKNEKKDTKKRKRGDTDSSSDSSSS